MSCIRPSNFILVGGVNAGKSTLFNNLLMRDGVANKTQALVYHDVKTVDTPGEYFDNPRLYCALISSMSTINTIIYVHPADNFERKMPPGLFNIYESRVIGVISKVDLPHSDTRKVRNILYDYGISANIFEISIFQPETINRLKEYLINCSHIHEEQDNNNLSGN